MFWVIQENLCNEPGFERLLQAIQQRSLPFAIVKVVPFTHELLPEPLIPDGPVIVSGSTILSKIAVERGWKPGALLNDNFDFRVWPKKYQGLLLNDDATIEEFGKLNPIADVFVRPCAGHKTFAGFILTPEDLHSWREQLLGISDGYSILTAETPVLIATPKQILREYRFFVVDGQVITGSLYKVGFVSQSSPACDEHAQALAALAAQVWQPDNGFVIDIALTSEGPKIIEINCLTAAGFYEADVDRLVDALETSYL